MAWNRWVGMIAAACLLSLAGSSVPAQPVPPPGTPGRFFDPVRQPAVPLPRLGYVARGQKLRDTLLADSAGSPDVSRSESSQDPTPLTRPAFFGRPRPRALLSRHRGLGIPLQRTSWRNRPWYAGWQIGSLHGSDLVAGAVSQRTAVTGGYWIGYDFDHYWGAELNWSFAYPELSDTVWNIERSAGLQFWDFDLLHYPWGDARYRPYFKTGLGVTGVHFEDERQRYFNRGLVTIPLGFGLKYYWKRWLALRFDVTDRIALGAGRVATIHHWSIVGGIEWRFGAASHVRYRP